MTSFHSSAVALVQQALAVPNTERHAVLPLEVGAQELPTPHVILIPDLARKPL